MNDPQNCNTGMEHVKKRSIETNELISDNFGR